MANLQGSLKVYNNIDMDFETLKSSGHFALIYTSFLSLYEAIGKELHKENIKLITCEIIEQLWLNKLEFTELSTVKELQPFNLVKSDEKKVHKVSFVSESPKKFDYSTISDFSYFTGATTFGREKRTSKPTISPGPADYTVNEDIVRVRSPQVATSKTKRLKHALSTNPGPGSYNPLYHFRTR